MKVLSIIREIAFRSLSLPRKFPYKPTVAGTSLQLLHSIYPITTVNFSEECQRTPSCIIFSIHFNPTSVMNYMIPHSNLKEKGRSNYFIFSWTRSNDRRLSAVAICPSQHTTFHSYQDTVITCLGINSFQVEPEKPQIRISPDLRRYTFRSRRIATNSVRIDQDCKNGPWM